MAFTQSQLTALEEAYAQGALVVEYRDASGNSRKVQFDTREGLRARIDEARAELGVGQSGLRIQRTAYSKGIH